jgi:shikimate kinase
MTFFLVGMMGSGKSHWAKLLAEKMQLPWLDLDTVIEENEGSTIAHLFEAFGEPYFRQKESQALQNIQLTQAAIIATGGGTPCFLNNMDWMNAQGITIWIDEPVPILVSRAMQQVAHRPAIQNKSSAEVAQLFTERYEARKPFYELAKWHVQGTNIHIDYLLSILQQYV